MTQRFQFSLKGLLVATTIVAVLAWMVSVIWPSHLPPTTLKLVIPPMLILVFFRLWALSRH
jgi:hypothetical protein